MAASKSRGKPYTERQLQFLREGYQTMTTRELAEAFNRRYPKSQRSFEAIKSTLTREGITCNNNMRKGHTAQLFTEAEHRWIEKWYRKMTSAEVAARASERFKRPITAQQIKSYTHNHGILSGRTGHFTKGHEPANKGLRRPGWHKGRMKETQFKPGPRPEIRQPMWHERIDRDGYILMKCPVPNPHTGQPWYYIPKHKWIWEQANGPIPENHVLTFIDDNPGNCTLENIELISRAELCRRNKMKYKQADPATRESIKLIAKLQHNIGAIKRQERTCQTKNSK